MSCKLLAVAPGLAGAVFLASSVAIDLPGPVQARVVGVIDGDTLAVRALIWPGQEVETRVRLKGIDAPELRGRCERERTLARAARLFIAGRGGAGSGGSEFSVRLRDVQWDKYGGRVIAHVEGADGTDLGQALVGAGLARPYHGAARRGWCD